jgi:hypothetical protein
MEEYECFRKISDSLKNEEKRKQVLMIAIKQNDLETIKLLNLFNEVKLFDDDILVVVQYGSVELIEQLISDVNIDDILHGIVKFDRADFLMKNNKYIQSLFKSQNVFYVIGNHNSKKILSFFEQNNIKHNNDDHSDLVRGLLDSSLLESSMEDEAIKYLLNPKVNIDRDLLGYQYLNSIDLIFKIAERAKIDLNNLDDLLFVARCQCRNAEFVTWLVDKISFANLIESISYQHSFSISEYPEILKILIRNAKSKEDFTMVWTVVETIYTHCENCLILKNYCICKNLKVGDIIHVSRQLVDEKNGEKLEEIFSTKSEEMIKSFQTAKSFYTLTKKMLLNQIPCKHLTNLVLSFL